jgi:chromosome partitioning protein
VRKANPVYEPLERFLKSLNLPLLARLSDSDVFLAAAEAGLGIFEMDFAASAAERGQFQPIADWVDRQPAAAAAAPRTSSLVSAVMRSGLRVVASVPGYR